METLVIDSIQEASKILLSGNLVGIPTETVYGLAADAFNSEAVLKIFKVKGRPADNPLIVHISEFSELENLVYDISDKAKILADKFWPGPLTMIFKKKNIIPDVVTASLDCVAVRMPLLEITRKLIAEVGHPLAAPSANLSGKPSPTSYKHVLDDLNGKIPAVLKGPNCTVGVESTVIDVSSDKIVLLRPGKISPEDISSVLGEKIAVDKSVDHLVSNLDEIKSPGVKYKHYSPKTKVVLIKGSSNKFAEFVNEQYNAISMCFDEDLQLMKIPSISYGSQSSESDQLQLLFDCLRKIDSFHANVAYIHLSPQVLNLAVLNRLLRASGFNVLELK